MKVLMLTQSIDTTRGPDGFIADWARVLACKVDKLTVLTYFLNSHEKLPKNIQVEVISGTNAITRNLNLIIETLHFAKDNDVIFSHILEIFGVVAGLVGKITGKKTYFWYCQPYDISKNPLAKIAFVFNDVILTCGDKLKNRYIALVGNWTKSKIIPVGHGIYLPHYKKKSNYLNVNKTIKILYAGRTSPIKDLPTLEKAIEILKIKQKKVELVVNGSYQYKDNYKIFNSADIFVNSSKGFSIDKTMLEAITCGVPSIGSDNAYFFMKDKFPQMVFKAGNEVDLAYKIEWIVDNPAKSKNILLRARKFVTKNFDLEKLMDKIVWHFSHPNFPARH